MVVATKSVTHPMQREAVKMVISGGIVTPPDRRPLAEQEAPKTSAATFEDIEIFREKEKTPVLVPKKK